MNLNSAKTAKTMNKAFCVEALKDVRQNIEKSLEIAQREKLSPPEINSLLSWLNAVQGMLNDIGQSAFAMHALACLIEDAEKE